MIYRVSCMYGHNRQIIAVLAIAFICELTSMIISQSIANNIHQAVPDPAPGVHICKQDSFPSWAYSIWVPIVFYETVMLILAGAMGISYYKSDRRRVLQDISQSSSPSLLYILVRDSITFPLIGFVICIVNLISWAAFPYLVAQMTFPFALFFPCILGSHLVINLREAYYQPFSNECEIQFAQDASDLSIDLEMP
ncbi:hypothetical protein CVT25_009825 [Psilocybe cyanescens]|uniref:G-protein coupled receptors family 1 profile domain-containing protein n=1 Tax=Psilocybe cyanescens TaxID=93625 RepID=A0A409X815_PSICY|nr:hypothetical protein CVT25_009825 [Psilocybe cyanescens]